MFLKKLSPPRLLRHWQQQTLPGITFSGSKRYLGMAWRCSGDSNAALIENMSNAGLITDSRVKEAFLKVCPGMASHPCKDMDLTSFAN